MMPIKVIDPWRMQYFDGVGCPPDVRIPVDDNDAWTWFPEHRWVYDKLRVAESLGYECGPHGIEPPAFPVFSKPVFNLRGMGTGSRIMRTLRDYKSHQRPGHIWMPLFEGEHVSTDFAVVDGEPRWWRHAIGTSIGDGMFDCWVVLAELRSELAGRCSDWLRAHMRGYTGMVNIETIGGQIIEVHLRFADQWPDIYGGRPWVESLVALYRDGTWSFDDSGRRDGYSVPLFGMHGSQYGHPAPDLLDEVRAMPGVSSVQITFHEGRPAGWHAMPPGGFRLAIVNAGNLETGLRARERLALSFRSTRQRIPRGLRKPAAERDKRPGPEASPRHS
jgi:hypothetical protein